MGCLFCEIAAGRREASIVHSDEVCIAFMDLHPVCEGHVLVIPRRHAERIDALDARERGRVMEIATAVRVAQSRAGFAAEGANLLLNDGAAANQHVPHLHVHVVPRRRGDGLKIGWRFATRMLDVFGRASRRARLDASASKLRAAMAAPDEAGG
jgi:histidine triad (HIT) family protein